MGNCSCHTSPFSVAEATVESLMSSEGVVILFLGGVILEWCGYIEINLFLNVPNNPSLHYKFL